MRKKIFNVIVTSLILLFVQTSNAQTLNMQMNTNFLNKTSTKNKISSCTKGDELSIDNVIDLSPKGYDVWAMKSGIMDGTFYETTIVFSDGVKGRIYKGGNSGRHFIEDAQGTNFYYVSLKAALRALYIYKKYNCITSKYSF